MNKLLNLYDFDRFSRQEVTFHHCQPGYHPDSVKEIVVWSHHKYRTLNYQVCDCAKGEVVEEGQIKKPIRNPWGRWNWRINLNDFKKNGSYFLRVSSNRKKWWKSPPFNISEETYLNLLEKAAKHIFLKRCGIFCHNRDAYLIDTDQEKFGRILGHRNVQGGWHDAHDDNKWVAWMWNVIYALCENEEIIKPNWTRIDERLPYNLAEAWWGVKFLLKMQKENGELYHSVLEWHPAKEKRELSNTVHSPDPKYFYDDLGGDKRYLCDLWGANKVARLLGRPLNSFPSTPEKYHAYLGAAVAKFARLIKPFDKKKSTQCMHFVKKILSYLRGRKIEEYQYLETKSALSLIKMEFFLLNHKESFLRESEEILAEVLQLQQPEGHFHSSYTCRGLEMYAEESGDDRALIDYPFAYLIPIVKYLDYFPEGRLRKKLIKSFRKFLDLLSELCQKSVFGNLPELVLNREPDLIMPLKKTDHGYNSYLLSAGYLLLAGAQHLKNKRYRCLGEKQIQWVLGANPRAMCFMNDVGYRNSGQYYGVSNIVDINRTSYYRHARDMRYGITVGMYGPTESQPKNYPNAGKSMYKKYDCKAQETWLNTTAWFMLAVNRWIMTNSLTGREYRR